MWFDGGYICSIDVKCSTRATKVSEAGPTVIIVFEIIPTSFAITSRDNLTGQLWTSRHRLPRWKFRLRLLWISLRLHRLHHRLHPYPTSTLTEHHQDKAVALLSILLSPPK